MDKGIREFERRHRAVTAKHRRLAEGYVTRLNPNGTIEHKPVRRVRALPLKGLALAVTGFVAFKGYLLASLGPADYATHVAHLGSGSLLEGCEEVSVPGQRLVSGFTDGSAWKGGLLVEQRDPLGGVDLAKVRLD